MLNKILTTNFQIILVFLLIFVAPINSFAVKNWEAGRCGFYLNLKEADTDTLKSYFGNSKEKFIVREMRNAYDAIKAHISNLDRDWVPIRVARDGSQLATPLKNEIISYIYSNTHITNGWSMENPSYKMSYGFGVLKDTKVERINGSREHWDIDQYFIKRGGDMIEINLSSSAEVYRPRKSEDYLNDARDLNIRKNPNLRLVLKVNEIVTRIPVIPKKYTENYDSDYVEDYRIKKLYMSELRRQLSEKSNWLKLKEDYVDSETSKIFKNAKLAVGVAAMELGHYFYIKKFAGELKKVDEVYTERSGDVEYFIVTIKNIFGETEILEVKPMDILVYNP